MIFQIEFCRGATQIGWHMRGFGLLIGLWMGLLLHGANAGIYALTDGSRVTGDPISYDETGLLLKTGEDSYSPRISWGKFTDEALRQLRDEAKNAHDRAIVEPMVSEEAPSIKAPLRRITVNPIQPPPRPSGHLGVLALFASPLGWTMLLILYGTNLFAAYEIAIYRHRPLSTVCGLAAIPLLGVATSLYFLALPEPGSGEVEPSPAEAAAGQPPLATSSLASPAPEPSGGLASSPAAEEPGASAAAATPARPELPEPVVFRRGDFSFNRRFFETKLTGFFRVVLSEADKDMLILITAERGNYVGKRISRITPSEIYLEVFKGDATAEEMIPFIEILEVQIRHKDLP
ncbi:MAG TPA: hypothetical protein VN765_09590 [Candidatus Acidoferrum sp.]|nr:hypothetical protein [Candidatus Acidoferrum sp.]